MSQTNFKVKHEVSNEVFQFIHIYSQQGAKRTATVKIPLASFFLSVQKEWWNKTRMKLLFTDYFYSICPEVYAFWPSRKVDKILWFNASVYLY